MSILAAPVGFRCGRRYRVRHGAVGAKVPTEFVGAFVGSTYRAGGWIAEFVVNGQPYPVHHEALMSAEDVDENVADSGGSEVHRQHMRAGRIGRG